MPHQVRNTDHGVVADGYDLDAAGCRELARKLNEVADQLDPFSVNDAKDGADDWIDAPKCAECKGTGLDIVNQIDKCPRCDGSGY